MIRRFSHGSRETTPANLGISPADASPDARGDAPTPAIPGLLARRTDRRTGLLAMLGAVSTTLPAWSRPALTDAKGSRKVGDKGRGERKRQGSGARPRSVGGFTNTANAQSPLGTNLAPVVDWSTEYPFVNLFRMARPWFSGPLWGWSDDRALDLDDRGNVKSLLPDQVARTILFTASPPDPGLSGKTLEVRWDGSGTVRYGNVDVLSSQPGRDLIRLRTISRTVTDLSVVVAIEQTNPANPVRNIRMVPQGGICANNPLKAVDSAAACAAGTYLDFAGNADQIRFHPDFLAGIKGYRSIRFMDWMRTNEGGTTDFARRPVPEDQFWSTERGVPLEVMVDLCNLIGADPWFNVHHLADDATVRRTAELIAAQLAPGRVAHVEWSNEVWNGIFDQTWHALEQGQRLGFNQIAGGGTDDWTGLVRYYSHRSQQVFDLFTTAFGGSARLRRVMSTQAVVPYFTTEILTFGQAASKTDLFAIAPYFGNTFTTTRQANELKRLGATGIITWLQRGGNRILEYGSLPEVSAAVRAQAAAAQAFGIPLTAYEGGQHLLAAGSIGGDAKLNALLDAVNRDARMKSVYTTYLNDWRAQTGGVLHHYVNCDGWSRWGRWGAREYMTQPLASAPKYAALMDYIRLKPLATVPTATRSARKDRSVAAD